MRLLSLLFRLTLILTLTLVSGHWAVGRSLARGAVALELCLDGSIVTVTLDARGNPVRQAHSCPDCVLGGVGLEAPLSEPVAPMARVRALAPEALRLALHPQPAPRALARGPPLPVVA